MFINFEEHKSKFGYGLGVLINRNLNYNADPLSDNKIDEAIKLIGE